VQHQDVPLVGIEARQGLTHLVALVQRLVSVVRLPGAGRGDGGHRPPAALVHALAGEIAHQPGFDRAPVLEAVNAAPCRAQRSLDQLFGQRPASRHQHGRAIEQVLIALHEVVERLAIAVLTAQDRLFIRHKPPS